MKNIIPGPILKRIAVLLLCCIGVAAVGVVLGVVGKDRTTMLLSIVLATACLLKTINLYRTAIAEAYDVYEGVVLSRKSLPLQKKQEISLLCGEDQERIILQGKTPLCVGDRYRLYMEKEHTAIQNVSLAPRFQLGRALLGYERISTATAPEK